MSQLTPSQRTARAALYNLESTVWHPGFLGQVHLVTEPVTSQSNPFLLAAETTAWHPRPHARLPFATEPVALQCNPFLLATEPPAWYPSSHTRLPFATEQLVRYSCPHERNPFELATNRKFQLQRAITICHRAPTHAF